MMQAFRSSVFWMILISPSLFAQTPADADSLQKALSKVNGEEKVHTFYRLATAHNAIEPAKAREYARKGIQLSKKIAYKEGLVDGPLNISRTFLNEGLYDSTLHYTDQAIKMARKIRNLPGEVAGYIVSTGALLRMSRLDSAEQTLRRAKPLLRHMEDRLEEAQVYNLLGYLFDEKALYDSAAVYYLKASEIGEEIGNEETMVAAYVNLAVTLSELNRYKEGAYYHKKAAEIDLRNEDYYYYASDLHNIASCYGSLGFIDSAIHYENRALDVLAQYNDPTLLIEFHTSMGNYLYQNNRAEEALQHYRKAESFIPQVQSPRKIANLHMNMTNFFSKEGRHTEAVEYLQKAAPYYDQPQGVRSSHDFYAIASGTYEKAGNYEKALFYLRRQKALEDSIFQEKRDAIISRLEAAFRTEEKEKELARAGLELQTKEAAIQTRNKWIISISSVLLMALALTFIVYQRIRTRQKLRLQEAIMAEKDRGFQSVMMAEEKERQRIARELHDGIGQQLSALKLSLSSYLQTESGNAGSHILNNLDTSILEVRSLSHQMMPRTLQEMGLIPAIRDLLDQMERSGINYSFEHFSEEARLPENIEIAIYRIIQELLNNVIKHSGASEIHLQLEKSARRVFVLLQDNGRGMQDADKEGIGLFNIKNRLDILKGRIQIEVPENGGTLANIIIPLNEF